VAITQARALQRDCGFLSRSPVGAALAFSAGAEGDTVMILGASGAIEAVMGAFLVTYPRDQIKVVWFFGWFANITYGIPDWYARLTQRQ
jgi:membrane associated rhomboid family serine protease